MWTVLFVVVNQVAYTVVVRLASGGTADGGDGTGYSIYSSTFLIVMVPHSIITVSLATAILPRLSRTPPPATCAGLGRHARRHAAHGAGGRRAVRGRCCRSSPSDLANVIWGHGAAAGAVRPLRAVARALRPRRW